MQVYGPAHLETKWGSFPVQQFPIASSMVSRVILTVIKLSASLLQDASFLKSPLGPPSPQAAPSPPFGLPMPFAAGGRKISDPWEVVFLLLLG